MTKKKDPEVSLEDILPGEPLALDFSDGTTLELRPFTLRDFVSLEKTFGMPVESILKEMETPKKLSRLEVLYEMFWLSARRAKKDLNADWFEDNIGPEHLEAVSTKLVGFLLGRLVKSLDKQPSGSSEQEGSGSAT